VARPLQTQVSKQPDFREPHFRNLPLQTHPATLLTESFGAPSLMRTNGPLRVLVVQSDAEIRADLERTVRLLGHLCRCADNGVDALAMHRADHADVILSDWALPGLSGFELCRQTRSNSDDGPYTYFIFLTRSSDRDRLPQAIDAGADDYQVLPVELDELRMRLTSAGRVIALYRKLAERNVVLRRDSQASFVAARVDPLTQVANRLRMSEDLEVLWSRARRYGHHYSAALCDIDWFKAYNDHFGHLEGDHVLSRVAQAIRGALRQGDGLYRYGGEEFLVLLPEQALDEACIAMERVRRDVERLAIPTVTTSGIVTISIGVSELSTKDETWDDWLRRVDASLYTAKEKGRNRVLGEAEPGVLGSSDKPSGSTEASAAENR
jgi:two-component system cell cycle response regulator